MVERKVYLVTGATSGIGLAVSKSLLSLGHSVFAIGRDEFKYESNLLCWAQENGLSDELAWQMINFSMPNSFYDLDVKSFPSFDGFVNSAGTLSLCPLKLETYESLIEVTNVNLVAPIELTRLLLKERKFRKGSSLVYLSSINGLKIGSRGHTLYAASKAGVSGFAMSLANELAKQRIRVNCVAPGAVATNMFDQTKKMINAVSLAEYGKQYPLGIGSTDSVVDLVNFLLSDKSSWITGQSIVIDGGFTLN
jgi:NAD(P)-dependent dehydrogenase (short-subunit alcohol dehydrogenase family)